MNFDITIPPQSPLPGVLLEPMKTEERKWLDNLPGVPFDVFAIVGGFEAHMLHEGFYHSEFNPLSHRKIYIQETHVGEKETVVNTRGDKLYYINQPMFIPTGCLDANHHMISFHCQQGFLHNASGDPAVQSEFYGNAYYLHGYNYEPVDYFKTMEKWAKEYTWRYPEYEPRKYIEYMAGVLGSKKD